MSVTVVYRRLCEPAQRFSLHFLYSGSIVGKKTIPGKVAICDKPCDHGDGFTHHRISATMGNGKVVTSQRYLWFNAGFSLILMCNRHPSMWEYGIDGALMLQLWKHAARLEHPPDIDASTLEVWCALTLVYQWQGSGGEKRGPPCWETKDSTGLLLSKTLAEHRMQYSNDLQVQRQVMLSRDIPRLKKLQIHVTMTTNFEIFFCLMLVRCSLALRCAAL